MTEIVPGFNEARKLLGDMLYPLLDERVLIMLKINQLQAKQYPIPDELFNELRAVDTEIDAVINPPTIN